MVPGPTADTQGLGTRLLPGGAGARLDFQAADEQHRAAPHAAELRPRPAATALQAGVALTLAGVRLSDGSEAAPSCTTHANSGRRELVYRAGSLWFMFPLHHRLPGQDIRSGGGDSSHSSSEMQFLRFWWNKWYSLSKGGYKNMCMKRMLGTWVLISFNSKTNQNK